MKRLYSIYSLILIFLPAYAQHAIIPEPVSYKETQDTFVIKDQVSIVLLNTDPQTAIYINQFINSLRKAGIKVSTAGAATLNPAANTIIVSQNEKVTAKLGSEGYSLDITKNIITLNANKAGGIFNGLQTLRQLFPAEFENNNYKVTNPIEIAGCKIIDYPRFSWRGLMLDVSRHFFSVADVKAFIDKMAHYKFNVFHWHLTDDEGWRIEIKSLPKLTEVGAWRVERHGRFGERRSYPEAGEEASYGGYYTQEQIKDIVKYAANRNITIVPEIDMPGHSMAALAAYPELSTQKEPKFVNPGSKFAEWFEDGSFEMLIENTLNPADEKVYDYIEKIFSEVAELFPGQYIHMGGDECYHGFWEADPAVQNFMARNKLKNSHELQGYFVNRVQSIIESKGKKMIGWDEILEGNLSKNTAVMNWHGIEKGIEALKRDLKVVMAPTSFVYLDYTQGDHSVENPIYSDLSLKKTYGFDILPEGVNSELVLGGQGNVWTEVIPNLQFAFYMTYPRALAISESVWSPREKKNWNGFISRTEKHFKRFEMSNTNISRAVLDPIIKVYMDNGKLMCKLYNSVPQTEIYYTVNNTYPVKFGTSYSSPFVIPEGDLNLRTQTFRSNKPIGRELIIHRDELLKRIKN